MQITLYRNKSDAKELDKDIEELMTLDGVLKESTSIVDPVLILRVSDLNALDCNYIRINDFNRYYYVNDIKSINSTTFEFSLHCDVLMSFQNYILLQNALIDRQEYDYNTMLQDNRLRVKANPYVFQKKFPKGFGKDFTHTLVIAGNKLK